MYRCENCNREFDEPKRTKTSYESMYGLNDGWSTPCTNYVCPYCGDDDITEFEEYDCYNDEYDTSEDW